MHCLLYYQASRKIKSKKKRKKERSRTNRMVAQSSFPSRVATQWQRLRWRSRSLERDSVSASRRMLHSLPETRGSDWPAGNRMAVMSGTHCPGSFSSPSQSSLVLASGQDLFSSPRLANLTVALSSNPRLHPCRLHTEPSPAFPLFHGRWISFFFFEFPFPVPHATFRFSFIFLFGA